MPSTHLSLHYHFVFSTKNREPWLAPTARKRVHEYIGGIIRSMNGIAHAVGGTGDHIHVAAGLRATHCLADVMREIKSESSRWIHEELRQAGFTWQEGYGAFTFAAPDLESVRAYVLNQEEHHRVKTFQENTRRCCSAGWWNTTNGICGERKCSAVCTLLAPLPGRIAYRCDRTVRIRWFPVATLPSPPANLHAPSGIPLHDGVPHQRAHAGPAQKPHP